MTENWRPKMNVFFFCQVNTFFLTLLPAKERIHFNTKEKQIHVLVHSAKMIQESK